MSVGVLGDNAAEPRRHADRFDGVMGPAGTIAIDRKDGTLLLPLTFVVGMVATVSLSVALGSL